ncbi:unnamed protein product [Moneuplotes crassus]|uniref:Uncharacterized protein n=1 Tax=Euplotes crassus TaxID=5936 RepID=A0AAD1U3N4_EUPCR|nr:unnamed protein product [Moneuplotes crassus]
MSLKCGELGFDIEELRDIKDLNKFGNPSEFDLIKQIRKKHFDIKRWRRIGLLKDKFETFSYIKNTRRNGVYLKPNRKKNMQPGLSLPSVNQNQGGFFSLTQANTIDLNTQSETSEKELIKRENQNKSVDYTNIKIKDKNDLFQEWSERRKLAKQKALDLYSTKSKEIEQKYLKKTKHKLKVIKDLMKKRYTSVKNTKLEEKLFNAKAYRDRRDREFDRASYQSYLKEQKEANKIKLRSPSESVIVRTKPISSCKLPEVDTSKEDLQSLTRKLEESSKRMEKASLERSEKQRQHSEKILRNKQRHQDIIKLAEESAMSNFVKKQTRISSSLKAKTKALKSLKTKMKIKSFEKQKTLKENIKVETIKKEDYYTKIKNKIRFLNKKDNGEVESSLPTKPQILSLKQALINEENALKRERQAENLNRTITKEKLLRDILIDRHIAKKEYS